MNFLISDIFLLVTAIMALIFASITDIKKREVPNWLSFSLIVIALAVRALAALTTLQLYYFSHSLLALALFFILSAILYYTKFFGGGDAKLLIGLAIIFATTPSYLQQIALNQTTDIFLEPFLLSFLINIFAIGSIYSIIFITFFAIKNKKKFSKEFKKAYSETKVLRMTFSALAILSLGISFFFNLFFFVVILALIFPYIYIATKATENISMIKEVSPQELTEGDWLAQEIKLKNKIIKPSVYGLSKKEIELLKKEKKKVLIKYGIPFVPVFLISTIITILFGNLLIFLLTGFLV